MYFIPAHKKVVFVVNLKMMRLLNCCCVVVHIIVVVVVKREKKGLIGKPNG